MTWDPDLTIGSPYGDNRPPEDVDPLRERLAENYADLIKRAAELAAAADRVPQQLDDESLRRATDFVAKQLKPVRKLLEFKRVAEKEPFLSSGRTVDAFFGELIDPLALAIEAVERTISEHLKQQVAKLEPRGDVPVADLSRTYGAYGGVATLAERVGFEVVDKQLACVTLCSMIDDEAIAKAVRSYIRQRGDSLKRDLAAIPEGEIVECGVRFFFQQKAMIR